jgi:hypothetical protein
LFRGSRAVRARASAGQLAPLVRKDLLVPLVLQGLQEAQALQPALAHNKELRVRQGVVQALLQGQTRSRPS